MNKTNDFPYGKHGGPPRPSLLLTVQWQSLHTSVFGWALLDRLPESDRPNQSLGMVKVLTEVWQISPKRLYRSVPLPTWEKIYLPHHPHPFFSTLTKIGLATWFFLKHALNSHEASAPVHTLGEPIFLPSSCPSTYRKSESCGRWAPEARGRQVYPSSHLSVLGRNSEGLLKILTWLRAGISTLPPRAAAEILEECVYFSLLFYFDSQQI